MDGACRSEVRVLEGNLRERYHLKDPRVDGRIILKWIFSKWDGGMDWNHLPQYRGRWRAVVTEVVKLGVQ